MKRSDVMDAEPDKIDDVEDFVSKVNKTQDRGMMDKGAKVKFIGGVTTAQIKWGSHNDPDGMLEKGNEYTVAKVEARSWHTKVFLKGFDGSFNSVWFEKQQGGNS